MKEQTSHPNTTQHIPIANHLWPPTPHRLLRHQPRPQRLRALCDTQSFDPRFLLTCADILVQSQWTRLERLAAVTERIPCLSPSPASARILVLSLTLFAALRHSSPAQLLRRAAGVHDGCGGGTHHHPCRAFCST